MHGLAEASGAASPAIDVVVPVYLAAAELERCLASLVRHTPRPPHRLVVLLDGPQPEAVREAVERARIAWGEPFLLLQLPVRRGFVGAANAGIASGSRDVVLLNSDTEVATGWLEGLVQAASSRPDVATVTPLSNNATICSVPELCEENLLPVGYDVDRMAALVARVAHRSYPELPTGVGVCLYVRRAALDVVGGFDEALFGLGYGEENDFCLRASAAGFVHLLDDATFVFHAGSRSFGPTAVALRRAAQRTLESRHPGYRRLVGEFIQTDPLRPIRERITAGLNDEAATRPPPTADRRRVLHVVHGWPPFSQAGTEVYARRLAVAQAPHDDVTVLARLADPDRPTGSALEVRDAGVRVRLLVNNFDRRNPLARNALVDLSAERELRRLLREVKPDLVHVHHLAGHAASLMRVPARLGVPVVYQIQDWWALCARANLVKGNGTLCPGPRPARCAACLPMTALPPSGALNRLLYHVRGPLLRRMLKRAAVYVMGSESVHRWYRDAGLLAPGVPAHVLPYGVPPLARQLEPATRGGREGPLVFGYIGSIMPHKGVHVAVEAFSALDPDRAELRLWGDVGMQPDFTEQLRAMAGGGPVRFMGTFAESDKAEVLGSLDVLVVPSIGMESFGIVAYEALAAGVPVLASRIGALAELPLAERCGALLPPGDVAALRGWVERLAADRPLLDRWQEEIPDVTDLSDHVEAIRGVYDAILGRRP